MTKRSRMIAMGGVGAKERGKPAIAVDETLSLLALDRANSEQGNCFQRERPTRPPVEPFLKWPGGKRWIASRIASYIRPYLIGRYYEPFLGGGAVFFALRPRKATLSDINEDLVNTYVQVRQHPTALIRRIRALDVNKDTYYNVRESNPIGEIDRAVRFLYLNRTAFAGMYRVNKKGQFNVPYGGGERTPEALWRRRLLVDAATVLRNRRIVCMDFERALSEATAGDVVYCDPTYTVAHNYNGFVRYNENNFSWNDQERLAEAAFMARERGALVLVSNAGHATIKKLYRPVDPITIERHSLISRDTKFRSAVKEFLFILMPSTTDDAGDRGATG